jgi:hypothetical protein
MTSLVKLIGLAVAAASLAASAGAQTIRQDDRIDRPPARKQPDGAGNIPNRMIQPVDQRAVRAAIFAIARAWNGQGLAAHLDRKRFYDKRRLLDTIARHVPRNAKLKILSIGAITTLTQKSENRGAKGIYRVSTVEATVLLQVEFIQPQTGFRRLQGRNIWTLAVEQRVR